MKAVQFEYQKEYDEPTTSRVVLVLAEPRKNLFGIDLSELSPEAASDFIKEVNDAEHTFNNKVALIMQDYDIRHRFRNFAPEKMKNEKPFEIQKS